MSNSNFGLGLFKRQVYYGKYIDRSQEHRYILETWLNWPSDSSAECFDCLGDINIVTRIYWPHEVFLENDYDVSYKIVCENCIKDYQDPNMVKDKHKTLHEEVLQLVNELDPECPDSEAYIDGHCSLYELVKRYVSDSTPNNALKIIINQVIEAAHNKYDGRSALLGINLIKENLYKQLDLENT